MSTHMEGWRWVPVPRALLQQAHDALKTSYDVTEYPAYRRPSPQRDALEAISAALAAAPSAPAPAEVPPHPERYYVWTDAEKRAIEAYAAAREAAAVERVRGVLRKAHIGMEESATLLDETGAPCLSLAHGLAAARAELGGKP